MPCVCARLTSTDCMCAGSVLTINKDDLVSATWVQVAVGMQVRLQTRVGDTVVFEGFKKSDQDSLGAFFASHEYHAKVESRELSVSGFNWGTFAFEGSTLAFTIDSKASLEIPLGAVTNANAQKNEISIDFREVCLLLAVECCFPFVNADCTWLHVHRQAAQRKMHRLSSQCALL